MSTTKFQALKEARERGEVWWEFAGLDAPKCPHCGEEYDITEHEAYNLYEDGEHDIDCYDCGQEFLVSVRVSYSYSTDVQLEGDE